MSAAQVLAHQRNTVLEHRESGPETLYGGIHHGVIVASGARYAPAMDRSTDRIEIRGLRAYGTHGVYEEERELGQDFLVDVTLHVDLSKAEASDSLHDTVDYGKLTTELADAVERTRFDLIEALAGHLAEIVLQRDGVQAVDLRIAKPDVRLDAEVAQVAVVLHRERGADTADR